MLFIVTVAVAVANDVAAAVAAVAAVATVATVVVVVAVIVVVHCCYCCCYCGSWNWYLNCTIIVIFCVETELV